MKRFSSITLFIGPVVTIAILLGGLLGNIDPVTAGVSSTQSDIVGPPGSGKFGDSVAALPNGNIVVTDLAYDNGLTADVGAVYLYNGATRALISTLTGSTAGDQVGSGGVIVLTNGNYVVRSTFWNSGEVNAGAVTWGSGTTGVNGTVNETNSLVGSKTNDFSNSYVTALTNGNYVVYTPDWDNGGVVDAGAATWGNGTTGITGVIDASKSLVGSTAYDHVGDYVERLTNGNYVVFSPDWNDTVSVVTDAGAATWGNGSSGIAGLVIISNSLVGSKSNDFFDGYVTPLTNGNYVVCNYVWDDGGTANVGAATWGNGATGIVGLINVSNSLIGSTTDDKVGFDVYPLTNGNYIVLTSRWDNGGTANVGAATWGDGTSGTSGTVGTGNSLVGSMANDQVGWGVKALTNGNYVVTSPYWANGSATEAGAATWVSGAGVTTGPVTTGNSLVGGTAHDKVGYYGVAALTNGNYVVNSLDWDSVSATDVGAATWGNGMGGTIGLINETNSLVGSSADDRVGNSTRALTNGNYVVRSPQWNNGVGAATWGDGTTGITDVVSVANSLVGVITNDWVGNNDIRALANGNYIVISSSVDNGGLTDVGAVTWGDGTNGTIGQVSSSNSLMGGTTNDQVGSSFSMVLENGDYAVGSRFWDNAGLVDSGAVTWGDGTTGVTGMITAQNSVLGTFLNGGYLLNSRYDYTNDQLVVGRPLENIVTLFSPYTYASFLPFILRSAP